MYVHYNLCLFIKCDTFPSHECFLSVQEHVESREEQAASFKDDTQSKADMTSHGDPQSQVQ